MVFINRYDDFVAMAQAKEEIPSSDRNLKIVLATTSLIHTKDIAKVIDQYQGRLEKLELMVTRALTGPLTPIGEALSHCQKLKEVDCLLFFDSRNNRLQFSNLLKQLKALEAVRLDFLPYTSLTPLLLGTGSLLQKVAIEKDDRLRGPLQPTEDDSKIKETKQFFQACIQSTMLQELIFCPNRFSAGSLHPAELGGLCNLLKHCTSLIYLEVCVNRLELTKLAKGLKHNKNIQNAKIYCSKLDEPSSQEPDILSQGVALTLYTSLQENTSLEELDVRRELTDEELERGRREGKIIWNWEHASSWLSQSWNSPYQSHLAGIAFLLTLNRAGRGKLLTYSAGPTTVNDWMHAIANEGDLSATYFFLRKNPALCKVCPTKRGQSIIDRVASVYRDKRKRKISADERRIRAQERSKKKCQRD